MPLRTTLASMLGNAKGWSIAGAVLVVEACVVAYGLSLDRVAPPGPLARSAGAMDAIALTVDPRTVVAMDAPGDAGPRYRDAAAAYLADVALYERFIRDRDRALLPKIADALDRLVAATHLSGGAVYADRPDAVVVYGDAPGVQALLQLGTCAIDAGLLVEKKEGPRATAYYESAFALGARLFEERLTYRELAAGVQLMSTAGACLARQAEKAGRAEDAARVTRFTDAQRDLVTGKLIPTFEALHSFNTTTTGAHVGDVFAFAADARERVWRVEATLKLGRLRFDIGEGGTASDQRHAMRLATRMAEREPDPAVRRAATLARDLTVEQFRMLR